MRQRRAALAMALAFCSAVSIVGVASAQIPLPAAKPADGAALFKQQCALCHTTNASDPPRQGPTLFNIVGREEARRVAGQSASDDPRRDHALPAGAIRTPRGDRELSQGVALNGKAGSCDDSR